jgi:hypothetical protein
MPVWPCVGAKRQAVLAMINRKSAGERVSVLTTHWYGGWNGSSGRHLLQNCCRKRFPAASYGISVSYGFDVRKDCPEGLVPHLVTRTKIATKSAKESCGRQAIAMSITPSLTSIRGAGALLILGTGHAYRFKMLADNLREREAELDETFKKLKSVSLFRDNLDEWKVARRKPVYRRRFPNRKSPPGENRRVIGNHRRESISSASPFYRAVWLIVCVSTSTISSSGIPMMAPSFFNSLPPSFITSKAHCSAGERLSRSISLKFNNLYWRSDSGASSNACSTLIMA